MFKHWYTAAIILSAVFFSSIQYSYAQDNSSYSIYTNNYYFPGDEILLTVNAYSIPKQSQFKFTVYRIKNVDAFFSSQTSNYNIEVLSKDSLNLLAYTEELNNFRKTFRAEGSRDYYYLYETVKFRNPGKGAYLVKASFKNKVAYTGFFVTELGMITQAANNGMLSYTINRNTGVPENNIDLSYFLGKRNIGTGKTVNGLFFKEVQENDKVYAAANDISYPLIIGKKGDDIVVSDPGLYFGYGKNSYTAYIFSDQPVYRPNAAVNFKGIIRINDGGIYKNYDGKDITVLIKDSRGAEVYKKVLKTNSTGSFNGDYLIPAKAPLGTYYIYANIGKDISYTGSFDVEEYKKPEYKVNITINKDQFTNGESVQGTVQSDYYFGSPVQDARVEYHVFKQPFYKPWWYFSEYKWWYEDYYDNMNDNARFNQAEMIYTGEGVLDKNGRFDFSYSINEDFKHSNPYGWYWRNEENYETDFTYIVQATVTDKSRREIASVKTFVVSRSSYMLIANTDKYLYKPEENVLINVRAVDFADKPVEIPFEAVINRVIWGEYPEYKQQNEYVTTVSGHTLSDGTGVVSFNAAKEGYYEIKITSKDDRGNKVTTETYCYVSTGDMWWNNQSGGIQIIPDRDSYKPGEICKALIITSNPNADVLVTVQNDNLLSYETHHIKGTSKLIDIPVGNNYSPNFFISVSYVKDAVFYTQNRSIMVVPDDKFLTVMIGTDKTTYKPKENGNASIRVTDDMGNPVSNAEIAIGLIDESIYAVKADNTKDIRKFFYSPKPQTVWSHYSNAGSYYGYSRLITIYERFNVRSLKESELGIIKGRVITKEGIPIAYAVIIIDGDFLAATTNDNGEFVFKLPEGEYKIGILKNKKTSESDKEIEVIKRKTTNINFKVDNDNVVFEHQGPPLPSQSNMDFELRGIEDISARTEGVVTDSRVSKKEKSDEGINFIQPELRSDFRDAVLWQPSVMTDADGMAYINIKYPDNLTTWRYTARVITPDTKVGQQVNTVITRKDLLVRIETPRFIQQKDEFIVSTIVHNYLDEDKTTKISLNAENADIEGLQEQTLTIGKNEEKRIDWKIKTDQPVGFAKLTAAALTNQESDAVEIKVPLQPHGLKISDFTSVDISDVNGNVSRDIIVPQFTDMRSTSLNINVSPSLASSIITALDQLVGYPYGCVEQTMSRFLPTVIVARTFKDLNAPLNEATIKDLPKMVEAGYNRLYSMQHSDGGWGWWTNDQSNPFMTAYVLYGLHIGNEAGYPVRNDVLSNAVNSVKQQLENNDLDAPTKAYMLYSLSFLDKDAKLFSKHFDKLLNADINDYAVSLLSMAAYNIGDIKTSDEFNRRLLINVKRQGENAAYWGGQAWHYNWQDDKVQTTAMAVKALINNPRSLTDNKEILDKAVRWLMMQKKGPAWHNTQETAIIIYALVDFLKTSKELEPDYNVKVYLNNEVILDKNMTRADIFEKDIMIPVNGEKLKSNDNVIRVEKNGTGKVYVTSQLDYYTTDNVIQPVENGFRVEKEYFELEKYQHYGEDKITYRKRYFDGVVKPGDEILVKVKVYARDDNMQYFMLEDPIPAGAEVVKDDWAYEIQEEKDYSGYDYYWWRWWYADKEIRDNMVSFFATYLYGKDFEFSYILKAQIPGSYNVIPATGMLMYYPEVRGSSKEIKFIISE